MSPKPSKINYREMTMELNLLMAELEQGNLDIEEAVKKYKRGLELIANLEKYLDEAENQIAQIKSQFKAGETSKSKGK